VARFFLAHGVYMHSSSMIKRGRLPEVGLLFGYIVCYSCSSGLQEVSTISLWFVPHFAKLYQIFEPKFYVII